MKHTLSAVSTCVLLSEINPVQCLRLLKHSMWPVSWCSPLFYCIHTPAIPPIHSPSSHSISTPSLNNEHHTFPIPSSSIHFFSIRSIPSIDPFALSTDTLQRFRNPSRNSNSRNIGNRRSPNKVYLNWSVFWHVVVNEIFHSGRSRPIYMWSSVTFHFFKDCIIQCSSQNTFCAQSWDGCCGTAWIMCGTIETLTGMRAYSKHGFRVRK